MQDKFPDARTLLSLATSAEQEEERCRTERDAAALAWKVSRDEAAAYRELLSKLIRHNEGKPILDGSTLWANQIQGCNCLHKIEVNLADSLELPQDMREAKAEWWVVQVLYEGKRYWLSSANGHVGMVDFSHRYCWPSRTEGVSAARCFFRYIGQAKNRRYKVIPIPEPEKG